MEDILRFLNAPLVAFGLVLFQLNLNALYIYSKVFWYVSTYWESVYTNRLLEPRLEALTLQAVEKTVMQ